MLQSKSWFDRVSISVNLQAQNNPGTWPNAWKHRIRIQHPPISYKNIPIIHDGDIDHIIWTYDTPSVHSRVVAVPCTGGPGGGEDVDPDHSIPSIA